MITQQAAVSRAGRLYACKRFTVHAADKAGDVPGAGQLSGERESLVLESEVETAEIFRVIGMTETADFVAGIDFAILVKIDIDAISRFEVACQLSRERRVECLLVVRLAVFIVEFPELIERARTDAVSLPCNLIPVVRDVQSGPIAEILSDLVTPVQGNLPAASVDFS